MDQPGGPADLPTRYLSAGKDFADPRLLMRPADQLSPGDSETTRGRTVTEADIVLWCSLTGDWFRIHSDAVFASGSIFGQRIAPGMMVLAFTGGLMVPPDTDTVIANYGLDRIRFPSPAYIGNTIYTQVTVSEMTQRDDGNYVVAFDLKVRTEDNRTVCSAILRALMRSSEGS